MYTIDYQPSTYSICTASKQTGQWRTLDNRPLRKRSYTTIREYHDFVRQNNDKETPIYGTISPIYQFFAEAVPRECGLPFDDIRTVYLDMEVESKGGFAPPEDPWQPITAIAAKVYGHTYVWGTGDYDPLATSYPDGSSRIPLTNVTYTKCIDEVTLLKSFLKWWTSDYPDIVSGWNIQFYDIPYLTNRLTRLSEQKLLKKNIHLHLSPWQKTGRRNVSRMGREEEVIDIVGIGILDLLEVYQKFVLQPRESYRLDAIAEIELGKKKVTYDEYGSLHKLAEENYPKFIDYNITDVDLVEEINDAKKLLHLVVTLAYGIRVNYADTFKQVRMWDAIMYYELHDQQIAIPAKLHFTKAEEFTGAFVKDPIVGAHKWVASFDVNSLYPSIMRQWNISPDRHLPIETLRYHAQQLRQKFQITGPVFNTDTRPVVGWLTGTCTSVDAPRAVWALEALVDILPSISIDVMLRDLRRLIYPDLGDPYPFLRVLNVCMTPNQQVFRADDEGFLPAILTRMYAERSDAKNKETKLKKLAEQEHDDVKKKALKTEAAQWGMQQNIRKVGLNSCYGAVGNEHHRFFDVRHAEAVTATGQVIIRHMAHQLNEFLNKEFGTKKDYVLAIDTDSNYVTLAAVVANTPTSQIVDTLDRYCEEVLQPIIDGTFEQIHHTLGTLTNVLAMKREAIAEHGVWIKKKRYILWVHDNEGVRYDPPQLKMSGIEAVRSSTPKFARDVIKKALILFVKGERNAFYELIDDAEHQYMTRPFEDIAMPRGCNGLTKYAMITDDTFASKTPIQVKGALTYNMHLKRTGLDTKYPAIKEGEKIRFCYLKEPNPLKTTVIAAPNTLPAEWKLDPYLDRYTQLEKTLLDPLEKIVSLANWTIRPVATFDALFD